MKRALVTGAAGFIGARACEMLQEAGVTVEKSGRGYATDRLRPESLEAIEGVDVVFHCAGGSSVGRSVTHPLDDFERSVPPTAMILERMREQAPRAKLVMVSSGAVYGRASIIPTPEDCATKPISPYGFHKRMCEELCESYARNYGIAVAIVRIFSAYGPGLRKQLFWDACNKARAGRPGGTGSPAAQGSLDAPRFSGSGDEIRDWLHVDDVVRLMMAAAQAASSPEPAIFNGGFGRPVRVKEALGIICRELGAEAPTFSGDTRAGDPEAYVADITRARALGWEPRVELSTGIAQYVAWYRSQR